MSSKQTPTSRTRFSIRILLILIVALGGLLRFYGHNWGDGLFFHPDEDNMARSISQMSLGNGLHPDFFAYGQFPLYVAYFSYQLVHGLKLELVPFKDAVYLLRYWSGLFSTLTIPLVYLITKRLINRQYGLLAASVVALMPGLIQAAHFGTTESLLTFLYMLIIYLSLRALKFKHILHNAVLLGIAFGLALGIKVSAIYFVLPVGIASLFSLRNRKYFIAFWLIFGLLTLLFTVLASPHSFLDYPAFLSSMRYETSVALGEVKVFYTRQFENSHPFIFQFSKVFPFAVGLVTTALGSLGGLLVFKERKSRTLILFLSFVIALAANGFMFAKWTRFMAPVFPLFAIFTAYALYKIQNKLVVILVLFIAALQGLLFFQIYTHPDTRIMASSWINKNIPDSSYILSETANVVDIPTSTAGRPTRNYKVISFDFYHLDQEEELPEMLIDHLEKADYIFVPSRRLFANLPQNKNRYPILEKYYNALFSGDLGYELVYTQRPSYCRYLGKICNWIELQAEETFSVFDHPTVRVYRKNNVQSSDEYRKLLL